MSEQSSLFVKIKIKKEKLEQFLNAKLTKPEVDENWAKWWDSREMYSKDALTEIATYDAATNREVLEKQTFDPKGGWEEEGVFAFSIAIFSENFFEIQPMLAWLTGIAPYMDKGDTGVAFIYDFFWGGDDVMAHVEFENQQAVFKTTTSTAEIKPEVLEEANSVLQRAVDILNEEHGH